MIWIDTLQAPKTWNPREEWGIPQFWLGHGPPWNWIWESKVALPLLDSHSVIEVMGAESSDKVGRLAVWGLCYFLMDFGLHIQFILI